jgi:hypothetical protein
MYPKELLHEQTDHRFGCAVQNEQGYLEGLERADNWARRYRARTFLAEKQTRSAGLLAFRLAITLVLKQSKPERAKSIKLKSATPRSTKSRMQRVNDVGHSALR